MKNVELVYDGGAVIVPKSMGQARRDQLQGTELERLGEVACRICYDSLGKGRSSVNLHKHILDVVNLSVYRHCVLTVVLGTPDIQNVIRSFANRKGVWLQDIGTTIVEVTINFQAILEWSRYTKKINETYLTERIGEVLRACANKVAPMIMPKSDFEIEGGFSQVSLKKQELLNEDQAWISLWIRGSRSFLVDQSRHSYGISARSTRFCDEGESEYIQHPMVREFLADQSVDRDIRYNVANDIRLAMEYDREAYQSVVQELGKWGLDQGWEKSYVKKQARSAGKFCLAHALETEMIFSAPISGWKDMYRQRSSSLADLEMQELYAEIWEVLKSSYYGGCFNDNN
jgi:hypothetical protein